MCVYMYIHINVYLIEKAWNCQMSFYSKLKTAIITLLLFDFDVMVNFHI